MLQMWRSVVDEDAGAQVDPWPDPGGVQTNPDTHLEVSAVLGEKNFALLVVDRKQAV